MKEITIEELNKLPKNTYLLVDIREESNTIYGMLPGAIHSPLSETKIAQYEF